MRIAWCTPFARRSAIGRISSLVVEELLSLAEVDIWHPQSAEMLDSSAPRITLTGGPADAARLATYDFAVYNMGNHAGNHAQIFEASRRTPGLVILHDIVLQDFFSDYYLSNPRRREHYAAALRRWYGSAAIAAASDVISGTSHSFLESPRVLEFPLFEEAVAGAYAVVTHSEFAAERVRDILPGIVRALPLPYALSAKARIEPRDRLQIPPGRSLVVTVGDVNPNKCIRSVLEVLGNDAALAAKVLYVVIGAAAENHRAELSMLVTQYGLQDTVRFAGYASEELLATYLTHADFCINLRFPNTEAASASAVEQLACGKPSIVFNTGFFAELPDDCVLKVSVDRQREDLLNALRRLTGDPPLRAKIGQRAQAYARETFRADRYARGIVEVGTELLDAKPLLAYTDRIGRQLSRMGVSSDQPLCSTVADVSNALFGK